MTIAPIVRTVQVKASPSRAFEAFHANIGRWWPHKMGVGKNPYVDVVLEPRPGGAWYEQDAEGTRSPWGKVLAWDPPGRMLLAWQLNSQWTYDPDFVTELEVTFAPAEGGGARVTLEHRNMERFGADAESMAGQLGGGWPGILDGFAQFVDA